MAGRVTAVLQELEGGAPEAREELFRLVYAELRRIASAHMRREAKDHTLQPTALVHEAYLKLVGEAGAWRGRGHFLVAASRAMREILVDHARGRAALRRGGGRQRVTLDERVDGRRHATDELLAVHEALARLEAIDADWSRVVELRYFGGLTFEEAAEVMGVSLRTVKRLWERARAWLLSEIER
jgi:RNA polymerase sigma factor (TIGR02999 family)